MIQLQDQQRSGSISQFQVMESTLGLDFEGQWEADENSDEDQISE